MRTTPARILCVGGVTLDRIFYVDALPVASSKSIASDYQERGGGMAATAAVGIAALGGSVRLLARVGDDPAGATLVRELAAAGVATDCVRVIAGGCTACSAVHIDRDGERMLTNFRGALSDDTTWIDLAAIASQGAVLADLRWPSGAEAALAAARAHAVPTVLDADAGAPEALARLLPLIDHAVFSAQGLAELVGIREPERALRAVRIDRSRVVGVTLGEEGSLWRLEEDTVHVPALKLKALNSNGVGDLFHGAYALAIAQGEGVLEAARFATAAAGAKCLDLRGWSGMPSRETVQEVMLGHLRTVPSA